ncbi:MAG: AAA family ATPase [Proteobacteria bacterium]|nr:AAA family ATPase [Pseudomonadota bacterium]
MYEEYFGLKRPPFKISPDTSMFFEGGKRGDILEALVYAIHRGEGIIKVVGEVGSGKTMLCRMLQLKLPKSVEIIYIANPSVSAEDILFVIANEMGLPAAKDASKHEVVNMLQEYLLQRHIEDKQVVLFIEEAQGMPLDTLEEIRLLSNLETDQHKLLQIILFGQPELDENLAKKSIRQLRERITHSFDLSPLTPDEIHQYLNFRIRQVGYTGPELITSRLAKNVARYSNGLLRRINIIADKILLSAYAEGTHSLTRRHVIKAVNDSAFGEEAGREYINIMWWLALPILFALAFAIYKGESLWPGVLARLGVEPVSLVEKQPPEVDKPVEIQRPVTEIGDIPEDTGVQVTKTTADEIVVAVDKQEVIVTAEFEQVTPEQKEVVMAEPVSHSDETGELKLDPAETEEALHPVLIKTEEALQPDLVITEAELQPVQAKAETELKPAVAKTEAELPSNPEKTEVELASDPAKFEIVEVTQKEIAQGSGAEMEAKESEPNYQGWLNTKLQQSRDWLINARGNNVSIQVLMRKKTSERELINYLQNEWPLNLDKTYLYEINWNSQLIYRVFYSEFDTLTQGRYEIQLLPESLKANSPYLHSVYQMQKALL